MFIYLYDGLPGGADTFTIVGRDEKPFTGNGKQGSANSARENLLLNFDPRGELA